MAVPKFFDFFGPLLRSISDGEIHRTKDVQKFIAADMKLSEKDLSELLPSQAQPTYMNRIYWAKTYLVKPGWLRHLLAGNTE